MTPSSSFRSDDTGKLLLRLAVGVVILFHGIFKVQHGVAWISQMLSQHGLPGFLAYGAYVAEIIAPVLILLGYRTRLAAIVVAFDMVVAIILVLRQEIFAIKEMGGGWGIELEALILLCALALFFMGGGAYGLKKGQSKWN